MESSQLAHIGVEATAFIAVVAYFVNENRKLQKQVDELREETQSLAKYIQLMETKVATSFNRLSANVPKTPPRRRTPRREAPEARVYNDMEEESPDPLLDEYMESSSEEVSSPPMPRRRRVRAPKIEVMDMEDFDPEPKTRRPAIKSPAPEQNEDDFQSDIEDAIKSDRGKGPLKSRMARTKAIAARLTKERDARVKEKR